MHSASLIVASVLLGTASAFTVSITLPEECSDFVLDLLGKIRDFMGINLSTGISSICSGKMINIHNFGEIFGNNPQGLRGDPRVLSPLRG